jgi:hypothetical protein
VAAAAGKGGAAQGAVEGAAEQRLQLGGDGCFFASLSSLFVGGGWLGLKGKL